MNSWSTSCFPIFGLRTMFKWSQICTFGCSMPGLLKVPNGWSCFRGVPPFSHGFPRVLSQVCVCFPHWFVWPSHAMHPTCHPGGRSRPIRGVLMDTHSISPTLVIYAMKNHYIYIPYVCHMYALIPSGKHTKNDGKSPLLMGKSTISTAIFNSLLYVYQAGYFSSLDDSTIPREDPVLVSWKAHKVRPRLDLMAFFATDQYLSCETPRAKTKTGDRDHQCKVEKCVYIDNQR